MNWGSLGKGYKGIAIKQLTAHEVDPESSNGHEFQGANKIRELLETTARRRRPTTYYFLADFEGGPAISRVVESTSSWYDGRTNTPHRAAEWRLYYKPKSVQELCHAGDLLLLALRNDDSLAVFFAPSESISEQMLLNAFGVTKSSLIDAGRYKWMRAEQAPAIDYSTAEAVEQLSLLLSTEPASNASESGMAKTLLSSTSQFSDSEVTKVAEQMIRIWPEGSLGRSDEIVSIILKACKIDAKNGPDIALERWLEVAEASYRIWEKEAARKFISPLRNDLAVSELELVQLIGEKWMSFRQSRVSRAGRVMEEFIAEILRQSEVEFSVRGKTEHGKLPEFIFPSSICYKDPSFPSHRLRILGSKTSFKDRWRQILAEGDRVQKKHGITRDNLITRAMFQQMDDSQFVVVMPQPIICRYRFMPPNLINLATFIEEVAALQKA